MKKTHHTRTVSANNLWYNHPRRSNPWCVAMFLLASVVSATLERPDEVAKQLDMSETDNGRDVSFNIHTSQPKISHSSSHNDLLSTMTSNNGVWRLLEDTLSSTQKNSTEPPAEAVYRSQAAFITGATLGSVAVAACVISCIFIYLNRKKRVVTVAQPPFLYLICFGTLLVSIQIYFYALDETSGLSANQLSGFCVASIWLRYTGFIIVYMSMFCKLLRVYRVMQFRRNQVIKMKHVLWPFVGVLVAALAVLVAMTIVNPPEWTRAVTITYDDDSVTSPFFLDRANKEFGYCSDSGDFESSVTLLLAISILIAAVMSCKTRHLPPDITDSRRVCQTLWCHIILVVLGLLLFVVGAILGSITMVSLAQVGVEFLIVLTTVSLMILPKMILVWRGSRASVGGNVHVSGLNAQMYPTHLQIGSSREAVSGAPSDFNAGMESGSPEESDMNSGGRSSFAPPQETSDVERALPMADPKETPS
jgi:7 transmembrane sweet-taste receptor of 3 GCPR